MFTVIAFGLLIGSLLGVLGAGGSVVTVPILVYALHEDVQTAAVTSLLIVAATAAVGAATHFREGTVRLPTALALSAVAAAGSVAGSGLRAMMSGRVFLLAFAGLLALVAALLWRGPRAASGTARECVLRPGLRDCSRLGIAGLAVGLLTGFFGVGGGFVIVPTLMLVLAFPARDAVGTSLVVVSLASLLALVPSLRQGSIAWAIAIPFAAGGAFGAAFGAGLSRRLPEAFVRRAFAVALVGLAFFVLSRNLSPAPSRTVRPMSRPTGAEVHGAVEPLTPSSGGDELRLFDRAHEQGEPTNCTLLAVAGSQEGDGCAPPPPRQDRPPLCGLRYCPTRRAP